MATVALAPSASAGPAHRSVAKRRGEITFFGR